MNIILNFKKEEIIQDMLSILSKKENIPVEKAVSFAINDTSYTKIKSTGWAGIAFDLWGHGEPEPEWYKLKSTDLKIELSEDKLKLLQEIEKIEKVEPVTAIGYFLIFEMERLGYHI